jgi:hypothetical protein
MCTDVISEQVRHWCDSDNGRDRYPMSHLFAYDVSKSLRVDSRVRLSRFPLVFAAAAAAAAAAAEAAAAAHVLTTTRTRTVPYELVDLRLASPSTLPSTILRYYGSTS